MPGARSTFSIIPPARRKEQSSRSAFFPHSLGLAHVPCDVSLRQSSSHTHTRRTRALLRVISDDAQGGETDSLLFFLSAVVTTSLLEKRTTRSARRRESSSLARATSASVQRRSYARACLSRDTSSGASSFGVLKRPSARRGPGIVSVDRNVRSKCRCSCVLQFTS